MDLAVITSGKNRKLQQDARRFLEAVGVREVDERVEIETILNTRYLEDSPSVGYDTHIADLTRFISFVKKEPAASSLFEDYYIFQSVEDWRSPSGIYLDSPFIETGLSSYYESLDDENGRVALSNQYLHAKLQIDQLCEFAATVGAKTSLEIIKVSCQSNPKALDFFFNAPGNWSNEYGVNSDYTIKDINEFLGSENEAASRLLWNTLCVRKDTDWLKAKYRNNSNYNVKTAPSQLVCTLRDLPWVPQTNGSFVRPSAALASFLPDGFPFDSGAAWLKAIEFGNDESLSLLDNSAMATAAKELGFEDNDSLEQAKRFASLPSDERQRFWTEFEQRQNREFPSHEPHNPDRRSSRVGEHAGDAPQRRVEERSRRVSIGLEAVKNEAEQYLRQQYTDDDGVMFCQICKKPMPFKLGNGVFYFEKVEFLRDLKLRHYQNYLALCPNHAAMFQFANGSDELLVEMFGSVETDEMEIILAERDMTVRFTKTHIADLKTIMEIDRPSST